MWYDRISNYYEKGYYTKDQVLIFVPKYITQEEYEIIVN